MKRIAKGMLVVIALSLMMSPAWSASLLVSVDGVDTLAPDSIWSYQMNFTMGGGITGFDHTNDVVFNTTSQHLWPVVPGAVEINNWTLDAGVNAGELVILTNDNSSDVFSVSPLVNGELFTVNYPDAMTLDLRFSSFLLYSDFSSVTMYPDGASFAGGANTLTFSTSSAPVPLPGAALLLGSGLTGLAVFRRRRSQD